MLLIPGSNAGLQDIPCKTLHRLSSERTNGSQWDVGRKQYILDRGKGMSELHHQGTEEVQLVVQLLLLLLLLLLLKLNCSQLYMVNHMFLVPGSNTGLQDIPCNRLHRLCSKKTNGSRWDVGRKQKILNRGKGMSELDHQGTEEVQLVVQLLLMLLLLLLMLLLEVNCIQRYMDNHMFLIPGSNAGLQDIPCNRLHRLCSKRTNGSRWDVGRKLYILDREKGMSELDHQGTHQSQRAVDMVPQ
jgi:uncharacterized integral membrane protein